ncbi:hypothetical protein JWG39_09790 [Desulforhopalus vacuolatus]|uniref:hypothetical protein n=1 Tax=Desulforhopalus vacuolatus TaxID=40414 RepID=UPI0019645280|nr:hypothetical protein [Desulforhopalus vacuolatus]MBM9520105.1 hypothetical protein [Desulforhopalus vacuolatus]
MTLERDIPAKMNILSRMAIIFPLIISAKMIFENTSNVEKHEIPSLPKFVPEERAEGTPVWLIF